MSQLHRRRRIIERKLLRQLPDSLRETNESSLEAEDASTTAVDLFPSLAARRPSLTLRTRSDPRDDTKPSPLASILKILDTNPASLPPSSLLTVRSALLSELTHLESELRGNRPRTSTAYPSNLTLSNWVDWTCLPTLVYELEYPRQERVDWWYIAEKTSATFGIIWAMIVVSQAYIYPLVAETRRQERAGVPLSERWQAFPWLVADMLFPLLLEQLLTWYVIWECVLNVLAEVTRFGDRGFYGDWWNAADWAEYARDWNRPVHDFLRRHVYNSSIAAWRLSKGGAMFLTFLLSALVHELVMWCLFRKVRGYLFAMQLMQLPLAALSRTRLLKGRKVLGNLVFWFGLFVGPSVLTSLYLIV